MSSKSASSRKAALIAKAKEKKLQRKEEKEQTDKYWHLVEEANKVTNPLDPLVSFQHYKKNGLNIDLKCMKRNTMSRELLKWAFDLTKTNMEALYQESWGWSDRDKMNELYDDRMWFLVAYQENEPVAFSSFRYEIQLSSSVTKKGLGTFIMQVLQLLAIKSGMHKVMATILHCNPVSTKFFMEKLKYQIDETSLLEECYDIVSKPVKR